jgi:nucleoid DNA-binding protein
MTKADLVSAMAKASGGSKVSAERALDATRVPRFKSSRSLKTAVR